MEMVELTVCMDQIRFDALSFYMGSRENTEPQKALEKMLEELYEKHVPAETREYLDSKLKPAPKPRPKRTPRPSAPKAQDKQAQQDVLHNEHNHKGGE